MVRKLFKHEILVYLRAVLPIQLILIAVAAAGRVLQIFEADHVIYDIIFGSAVFAFVVGCIGCIVYNFVFAVIRFYKNLFSGEGYLTFTLPVTSAQHIWVKLLIAFLFQGISVVIVLVSVSIMTAGDMFTEIIKALGYMVNSAYTLLEGQLIFYVLEAILLLIVTALTQMLLYYTCISIGQLAHKNRVLAAIGAYFVYYFMMQILSTILMVVFTSITFQLDMERVMIYISEHYYEIMHWILCGASVITSIMGGIYFLIVHSIIHKKLNLE